MMAPYTFRMFLPRCQCKHCTHVQRFCSVALFRIGDKEVIHLLGLN